MKKIIYLLTLLTFGFGLKAQNIGIYSPNPICFNSQGTTTTTVYMTNSISASSYSWSSNTGSCGPQFTYIGNGSTANVYYPCCGTYDLVLTAYNSSNVAIAQTNTIVSVICSSLQVTASATMVCSGSPVTLVAGGASSYTWSGPGLLSYSSTAQITPSASACYTVSGNSNGCIFQKSICILVNQSPAITITGQSVACQGDTIKLTASGGLSYSWSNGASSASITTIINSTTCYSVVGTNSMNCSSMAVKCINVGTNAVINGSNTVCSGNSIMLTGSGSSSYTWLPSNSNLSSIVVSPTTTTCYTLLANGLCGSSSAVKCVTVLPKPTVSLSVSGGCSSAYTITASGAQNYVWSNGMGSGGSIVVSPSVTTCYSVSGSNSFGCSAATSTCLAPTSGLFVSGPTVVCNGGSATLTAYGASGSYTWLPGNSTAQSIIISPSVATCYTVFSTFTNNCLPGLVHCVNVGTSPQISTFPNTFCAGQTGSMVASGGSSYIWYPFQLTGSIINITPTVSGCYTVVGTNTAGCSGQATGCYTVLPSPTISISGASTTCSGGNVTLTATGGNNYNWQPGNLTGSVVVVTPTANTCYTVQGSNGNCTGYASKCIIIQQNNVTFSGPSSLCAGNSASITALSGNSFTWSPGNFNTQSILISPTVSSCYTVSVTYSNGCSGSGVKCVTVYQKPTITTSGGSFCSGNSGVLTASGGSSYTWTPFNLTGASIVVTPSVGGCYTVTGSNTVGCTNFAVGCYSVSPSPTISISGSSVLCPSQSATLTASGATSYTWVPGNLSGASIVISPSTSVCYTVFGSNGVCSSSAVRCVTVQNTSVSVTGPTFVCIGSSATLSASGSSGYTWQPGNITGNNIIVTPTVSTCYTVTGSNSNGTCIATAVKCVSSHSNPAITTNAPSFCYGITGVITASGATSYTWQPFNSNNTSVSISPTVSGCYTVTGSNGFGCKSSATGCYSVMPNPTITVSGNLFVCSGSSTTLTATGANTYTWQQNGFPTTAAIVVTPTANTCYTVGGHSSSGCSTGVAVCVSVQTPTLQVSGPNVVCMNNNITLTANGAVNYTWMPGAMTGSAVVVSPTANTCYSVMGTSPNGSCTSFAVKCVTVAPAFSITTTGGPFCAGQSGTLTASGATGYTWYPFNKTGPGIVITPSVSGCYTVVGTSPNGCSSSAVNCYSVNPAPSINVSGNSNICAGNSTTLTAVGATSYTWLPGGNNGSSIVVSPAANTCYTVIGSNGACTSSGIRCVTVQQTSLSISGPNALCGTGGATLSVNTPGTYTWEPGGITGSGIFVTPTVSTCYTVSGYSSANCLSSAVKCVSVVPNIQLTTSGNQTICAGQLVNISVTGANTYSWSNGSNSNAIFVSPAFSTNYAVTGFIGACSTSTVVSITVIPLPVVSVVSSAPVVCSGSQVQLIANGAGNYTWNWSTGQTGNVAIVTPTANTVYTVTGTNAQGCSRTTTVSITVFGNCVGLEEADLTGNLISLYPNPSSGEVKISTSNSRKVNFVMYDMLGREIMSGEFTGNKTINMTDYNNGSYIMQFKSGENVSHQRLIINK